MHALMREINVEGDRISKQQWDRFIENIKEELLKEAHESTRG